MTRKDILQEADMDQDLAAFFAAGQAEGDTPSDRLMLNVLADAKRAQPQPWALPERAIVRPIKRFDMSRLFGGWQAGSALASFLALGVFLGYTAPVGVTAFTDALAVSAGLETGAASEFSLDDLMAEG
ncbi:MAG: hypothetical protein QNL16_13525 [Rhodobacterales bacterium]|jgi:hypothetical protein|nr:hypothetical protein [Pseudomonadota bacterium]MDA1284954.1 hypothetical protein [Pseudomonadota bacterium]NQW14886.1 hypothetical protein [Rhodobacter sp.]